MPRDATEILFVLDQSGSMGSMKEDAIGGFNQFIEEQKAVEGIAHMTLMLFNSSTRFVHERMPIADVTPLDGNTYRPGGFTALYDAVGSMIDSTAERLGEVPADERPDKVVCVILTDGLENSSKEYTSEQIKEKIAAREEAGWVFVYLGADQNAFTAGASMGINAANTANVRHGSVGLRGAYVASSNLVQEYRTSGLVSPEWRGDDVDGDTTTGGDTSSTPTETPNETPNE